MKTSPEQRDILKALTASFMRIHKMLLELQMSELERIQGAEIKPATRLGLLLNDPNFAWLRNLSQLMAIADDIYFQKEEILPDQMERVKSATEDLLVKQSKPDFTERYNQSAQKLTALMLEHAQLINILKEF